MNSETEKRIRNAVKPGDPWALDELTEKICGDDRELRSKFSEIVADDLIRAIIFPSTGSLVLASPESAGL